MPEGAGAALLKERRRQGLSLGDISRQLKLSVRQVEALERDDYSAYKGPVFIHGFIRNYAKLLGLDPLPLVRAADAMLNAPVAASEIARDTERLPPLPVEKSGRRLGPAMAVVILVGIALAAYFASRRAPDAGHGTPAVVTGDKSAPASKAVAETKPGSAAKARSEPRMDAEPAPKPVTKPEAKTQQMPESGERRAAPENRTAPAAESSGRVTVRMVFEQESWVEIKDRTGKIIFGQLNPAGSRRIVSGEPPLSVVVGNAAGVRLFRGDNGIDLAPHTRVDVARLTLE